MNTLCADSVSKWV